MSDGNTRVDDVRLYIVRLWSAFEPGGEFRAAVLRAGGDESAWFTRADSLADFFARQARSSGGTGKEEVP